MTSCNSWQYLSKILANIFPRSWQDLAKILLRYPWRFDPGIETLIIDDNESGNLGGSKLNTQLIDNTQANNETQAWSQLVGAN